MKDKFDIYSFIGNGDIREYMKKHKVFSDLDKARIIIFSYRTVKDKIASLNKLTEEIDSEKDKKTVIYVSKLLTDALNTIYNLGGGQFINIARGNMFWNDEICNSYEKSMSVSPGHIYKSFNDFINDYEVKDQEAAEEYLFDFSYKKNYDYIVGDVISYENIGQNDQEEISFEAAYFGNKIDIFHITVSEEWASLKGYSEEVVKMLSVSDLDRYSFPYKYGESVYLKTPFMPDELYGGLYSAMDGNGCWYHFLYYEKDDGVGLIDLSYHEIDMCSHLSVFDWIYNSKVIGLTDSVRNELFDKNLLEFLNYKKIAELTESGYAHVFCSIKVNDINNYPISVTIKDESGTIEGQMCICQNDITWLQELEETEEKIYICGHFIKDTSTNKMYMDFHCDVIRLSDEFINRLD